MNIKQIIPISLLCSASVVAGQGDQVGQSRYSIATHNAHAINGINAASANAHLQKAFNFGSVTSLYFGGEVGDVDFADEITDLIDELDRDDITLDESDELKTRFDDLLVQAGLNGYVNIDLGAQLPLSFAWKRELDTITVSSRITGNVNVTILDAPLEYNALQETIGTNAAGYVKVANLTELSIGYSRLVWQNKFGDLHAGGRVNIQSLGLSKQVIAFESADGDDDLSDVFLDDYEDAKVTNTDFSVDLSAYWAGINYNAGITLSNINEPEFEFGELGNDCVNKATTISRDNCFTALHFSNRIALKEVYVADSYATLQANYISDEKTFSVDFSYETEHNTPVGVKEQWLTASIATQPESIYIPNARLTYSNNLAGSKLDYLSGELTWGWVGLAGGYALSDTTFDDTTVTRGGFISLSVSNHF